MSQEAFCPAEKSPELLTSSYFSELLIETKEAHLNFQKEKGTKVPWASWYAEYITKCLKNIP